MYAMVVCITGDMHGEGGCMAGGCMAGGIVHGKRACNAGACMAGAHVQERRQLKRPVCILLECILSLVKSCLLELRFNPRNVRLMSHQSDCSFRDYTYIFDRHCCC